MRSLLLALPLLLCGAVALCDEGERVGAARAAAARGDREALAGALVDPALSVRRAASEGLARLGSASLTPLLETAQGKSHRGRLAARRGLRLLSPAAVTLGLREVCASLRQDEHPPALELTRLGAQLSAPVRGELAWAIARPTQAAAQALGLRPERLDLGDERRRGLARLGTPALDACALRLAGADPEELRAALRGVAAFGSAARVYEPDVVALVPREPALALQTLSRLGCLRELTRLAEARDTREDAIEVLSQTEAGAALLLELVLDPERSLELRTAASAGLYPYLLTAAHAPRLLAALRALPPGELQEALTALVLERQLLVAELARHPDAEVRRQVAARLEDAAVLDRLPTELLEALATDEEELPELRGAALYGLGRRRSPAALELARALASSPAPALEAAALWSLAHLRDERSLPTLIAALQGPFRVAQAAKAGLASWGPPAARQLAERLDAAGDEERELLLRLLAGSQPPAFAARPALAKLLTHPQSETRLGALEALAVLARLDGRGPDPSAALADPSDQVRGLAGRTLAWQGEFEVVGERAASEPRDWVRQALVRELGAWRSAQEVLRELSRHSDLALAQPALVELAHLSPATSAASLGPRLLDAIQRAPRQAGVLIERALLPMAPHLRPELRARAGRVLAGLRLAEFGSPLARARCLATFADQAGALEHLREDLRAGESWRRRAAARGLASVGSRAAPALVDLVERVEDASEEAAVRESAARALGQVPAGAELSVPALRELLDSLEEEERWAAFDALARLGPAASAAEEALADLVADPDHPERALALSSLAAVGSRSRLRPALERHSGEGPPAREAALCVELGEVERALGLLERVDPASESPPWPVLVRCGPAALTRYRALLASPGLDPEERLLGIDLLGELRGADSQVLALLEELAATPRREAKRAVLAALARLAERSPRAFRWRPAFVALLRVAEVDEDAPGLLRDLLAPLGPRAAPALPVLTPWLRQPARRALALELIGGIGPAAAEAAPFVAPYARIGEQDAGLAALTLLSIAPARARASAPVLRWALYRSPPPVAVALAGVLGRLGGDAAEEALLYLERVLDHAEGLHHEAVRRLVHHGERARSLLESLAADPDRAPALRAAARRSLSALRD